MENLVIIRSFSKPPLTIQSRQESISEFSQKSIKSSISFAKNPVPKSIDSHLDSLCKNGSLTDAVTVLDSVAQQGSKVTPRTYMNLLQSCIDTNSINLGRKIHARISVVQEKSPVIETKLVSMYAKCGYLRDARKVFDEMLERKCAQTVLSFNALLGACVNSKKFDEVDGLFRGLSEELGIEPDLVSYNTVMKAFCEMGSLDSAVSLLDEMEKKGLKPDLITFNTILNGLYANGRFDVGERTWQRMKENNVKPDGRSYNEKLLGLALERRMEDAVKVVEEMKSEGIQLDAFSYSALIRGFVNDGDLKKAKHWYHELGRSGCKLDRLTLEGLIPFALQKGDFMFAYGICKYVLCSKLPVQNVLIQSVVDALAKKSKIEAARELVKLGDAHPACSYKLNLPSF